MLPRHTVRFPSAFGGGTGFKLLSGVEGARWLLRSSKSLRGGPRRRLGWVRLPCIRHCSASNCGENLHRRMSKSGAAKCAEALVRCARAAILDQPAPSRRLSNRSMSSATGSSTFCITRVYVSMVSELLWPSSACTCFGCVRNSVNRSVAHVRLRSWTGSRGSPALSRRW